eukprot:6177979-Pleurochrysis_carterae.AAC.2
MSEAETKTERLEAQLEERAEELERTKQFIPPKEVPAERLAVLSKSQRSQLRQADLMYLYGVLTSRDWATADLADALLGADVLERVFRAPAICPPPPPYFCNACPTPLGKSEATWSRSGLSSRDRPTVARKSGVIDGHAWGTH